MYGQMSSYFPVTSTNFASPTQVPESPSIMSSSRMSSSGKSSSSLGCQQCCQNVKSGVTDARSSQSICSCQYSPALLSPYTRLPVVPNIFSSGSSYSAGSQNTYVPLGTESSAFYTPLGASSNNIRDGSDTWRSLTQPSVYDTSSVTFYSYGSSYSGLDLNSRRKNATRESTNTLKAWLQEHIKNPYPSKGEKIMLAIITKMTLTQVSTWFANARRRLKKDNKMTWSPRHTSEDGDDDEEEHEHSVCDDENKNSIKESRGENTDVPIKSNHVTQSDDVTKSSHVTQSDDVTKSSHVTQSDDVTESSNVIQSDDVTKFSQITHSFMTSNNPDPGTNEISSCRLSPEPSKNPVHTAGHHPQTNMEGSKRKIWSVTDFLSCGASINDKNILKLPKPEGLKQLSLGNHLNMLSDTEGSIMCDRSSTSSQRFSSVCTSGQQIPTNQSSLEFEGGAYPYSLSTFTGKLVRASVASAMSRYSPFPPVTSFRMDSVYFPKRDVPL